MSIVQFILSITFSGCAKQEICLHMIMKSEKRIIGKILATAKGIIDYCVIVDTGCTYGTQEWIRNFMKDIPGELDQRPWLDFPHNRNEALS